jgi:hypothetical protein
MFTLFAAVSTAHFLDRAEDKAASMKLLEEFLGVGA